LPALGPERQIASGNRYNPSMTFRPDVTVAALAVENDRFLLVEERIEGRLVLNQPAGHLEAGESLLEAVAREAREETAWRFEPDFLLGVYLWRHPHSARATLRFAFGGRVSDFDPRQPLDRGIVRTHWLSRDEIHASAPRLRTPLVSRCVDDYLSGRRLPLEALACVDATAATPLSLVPQQAGT
jgi:8-oxo-dGTP pyrophosphatase MutT (NUDIX family)